MRTRLVVLLVTGAFAIGLVFVVVAQQQEPSSQARAVPCPSVGPSGQTGDMNCLDNPAHEYTGGAEEFGPFRLLPPGTRYITRDYAGDTAPREFRDAEEGDVRAAELYMAPPEGFAETLIGGTLRNDEVISYSTLWTTASGERITVGFAAVAEWELPLDVYLYQSDSLLKIEPTMIDGRHAIVETPAAGPAPNVGHVAMWLQDERSVVTFRSPDVGSDQLEEIALAFTEGLRSTSEDQP